MHDRLPVRGGDRAGECGAGCAGPGHAGDRKAAADIVVQEARAAAGEVGGVKRDGVNAIIDRGRGHGQVDDAIRSLVGRIANLVGKIVRAAVTIRRGVDISSDGLDYRLPVHRGDRAGEPSTGAPGAGHADQANPRAGVVGQDQGVVHALSRAGAAGVQRGISRGRARVSHRDRGRWRLHGQADRGAVGALAGAVLGEVGEAVRPGVARRRGIGEGAVGLHDRLPVRGGDRAGECGAGCAGPGHAGDRKAAADIVVQEARAAAGEVGGVKRDGVNAIIDRGRGHGQVDDAIRGLVGCIANLVGKTAWAGVAARRGVNVGSIRRNHRLSVDRVNCAGEPSTGAPGAGHADQTDARATVVGQDRDGVDRLSGAGTAGVQRGISRRRARVGHRDRGRWRVHCNGQRRGGDIAQAVADLVGDRGRSGKAGVRGEGHRAVGVHGPDANAWYRQGLVGLDARCRVGIENHGAGIENRSRCGAVVGRHRDGLCGVVSRRVGIVHGSNHHRGDDHRDCA